MTDASKATGGHIDPDGPGLPALIENLTGCRPTSVTVETKVTEDEAANCTTHHDACPCREYERAEVWRSVTAIVERRGAWLTAVSAALDAAGAPEAAGYRNLADRVRALGQQVATKPDSPPPGGSGIARDAVVADPNGQPDGIDGMSNDLPTASAAAERVHAYVIQLGDGCYHRANDQPLYARDLTALAHYATGIEHIADQRIQSMSESAGKTAAILDQIVDALDEAGIATMTSNVVARVKNLIETNNYLGDQLDKARAERDALSRTALDVARVLDENDAPDDSREHVSYPLAERARRLAGQRDEARRVIADASQALIDAGFPQCEDWTLADRVRELARREVAAEATAPDADELPVLRLCADGRPHQAHVNGVWRCPVVDADARIQLEAEDDRVREVIAGEFPAVWLNARTNVSTPDLVADALAEMSRALHERDPQPAGQAPVTGYTKQPSDAVALVNMIKGYENAIGDLLAHVQDDDAPPTDPRMIEIARHQLQDGFMWLVRAVFQPESRL